MDSQTVALWQLIATIAGVAVVVWYSFETRWLRLETRNLLNEARIQNETALRPIIELYFSESGVPGDQKNLRIRNVGRGPAFSLYAMPPKCNAYSTVSVVLPESVPAGTEEVCHFDIKNVLGPNMATSPSDVFLLLMSVTELPLSIKITYTSADGKRYFSRQIVTADGELAKLIFGGSERMDDNEG